MFVYLFIGAIVFCRIEAPLEQIEHETYAEFRSQWTKLLTSKGISGKLSSVLYPLPPHLMPPILEPEIDRLFANIRDAALNGIWSEKNVTSEPNWT